MSEVAYIDDELLGQRLIQPKCYTDLFNRSFVCGRAGDPAVYFAGSPGSARVSKKLMTTTPMTTGTACAIRASAVRKRSDILSPFQGANVELSVEPKLITARAVCRDV